MTQSARSDALHAAVQRFAAGDQSRDFSDLALEIAAFQAEFCPGFARLVARQPASLAKVDQIPGVPCDAFRMARVAVHPENEDCARFFTSGTTSGARGMHAMRTLDTYRALALRFGRSALLATPGPRRVVALAPKPDRPASSSLGQMMAMFMSDFEGREEVEVSTDERWLMNDASLNVAGLNLAASKARQHDESLLVLATSFALVAFLDDLRGSTLPLPASTVIMQTGGFKGKTREIDATELRRRIAAAFGIVEAQVVSEYGMTELTSQLYEATLPGSALQSELQGRPGVYYEPDWLRVVPVDPIDLQPVAAGEVGIARIIDLGNVDSAVAIQTQDRVRRIDGGIELLGRAPGAPARGCSLAVEEFLRGH